LAGVGSTSITYDYVDGNGCANSAVASITIDGCLSIDEMNSIVYTIYPNPASASFSISSTESIHTFELTLFDMIGKKVSTENHMNGNLVIEFSIGNINPGVYFIKGSINNQNVNLSVTVK